MPKLHHVTIPQSVYAQIHHWLANPTTRSPYDPRLTLATMLVPMIRHVRLFPSTDDELPKILEWWMDTDAEGEDELGAPSDPAADFEQLKEAFDKIYMQHVDQIDLFLGLSVNPTDETLSIDVTTEPALEGEDLTMLAAAAAPKPWPEEKSFRAPPDDDCYSTSEAARFLGVARSTVTRRIRNDELIGFRTFKNALRVPKEQFRNGDVVAGIAEVLSLFKSHATDGTAFLDHKAAWMFLASTIYPGDAAPRPIDRLHAASAERPAAAVLDELALAKRSLDHGDHV